jgi:glycerate 2-kinase
MGLPDLHRAARDIFDHALKSVDANEAMRRAVILENSRLTLGNTSLDLADYPTGVYAVAIGKAARRMASTLNEILGNHLTAGVIAAPTIEHSQTNAATAKNATSATLPYGPFSERWRVFEGGHPVPNRASLDAALAAFDLLRLADGERAPIIFLISGGGSALIEWPREASTTLEELRAANEALISSGASILEINAVRCAFSAIKGGRLARSAPNCDQVSLIVSDTNTGEEAAVASGPSLDPSSDFPDAASVIARYKLEATLPESILRATRQPTERATTLSKRPLREHYVLLDNERALAAAADSARSLGFTTAIARDLVEQPIAEGCSMLLSQIFQLSHRRDRAQRGVCLISGGEFACPVRGGGVGGRNAQSALRWAIELGARDLAGKGLTNVVALSAGTDGIDGNSPAAGALSDETTVERARRLGLEASRFLDESDAYTFFTSLGDTIITGPTGTNVRDLRVMIATYEPI